MKGQLVIKEEGLETTCLQARLYSHGHGCQPVTDYSSVTTTLPTVSPR
jgi:hypothetical protein